MNIMLNMRDLRKMNNYFTNSQIAEMIEAIVKYVDDDIEYDYYNGTMQMVWDDIKPMLDKSKENYAEWLKKERGKKIDKAMKEIMDEKKF